MLFSERYGAERGIDIRWVRDPLDLDEAIHQGRIDVSGQPQVTVDSRLPAGVAETLAAEFPVEIAEHGVYPALFACPNAVTHHALSGEQQGAAYTVSPWAKVATPSPSAQ